MIHLNDIRIRLAKSPALSTTLQFLLNVLDGCKQLHCLELLITQSEVTCSSYKTKLLKKIANITLEKCFILKL